MPSDFAFRLSAYLTLALSCVCIGYSEWDLLPESGVLAVVVLILLAVSFRSGSRYELDLQSANRVGLVIGLLAVGWLAYQFINKNSLIYTLPWPASLLPYLGPLLMVLMPAKLFRPKHVGDWWAMQGIALAGVGLASSMAETALFGVLLGLYAAAGVTSLTLFFYRRTAGTLAAVPNSDPGPTPTVMDDGRGRSTPMIWCTLGWLILAIGIGLPCFFLTPRSQAPKWHYGKTHEVGLSGEHLADLTHTGDLTESRAVAFEVHASYPDGRPKEDLSLNHRWRAFSLNHYEGGRWTSATGLRATGGEVMQHLLARTTRTLTPGPIDNEFEPPDLGPDQYRLEFRAREHSGMPVLSDPVSWVAGKPPPVGSMNAGQTRSWFQFADGSFRPRPMGMFPGGPVQYVQVTRSNPSGDPSGDVDLSPPFDLRYREPSPDLLPGMQPEEIPDPLYDPSGPLAPYRSVRLPKLQFWTRNLLERLATTNPSIRDALGRAHQLRDFLIAPADYEPVARALSEHLAGSGEYHYSLKLRRIDTNTDPVEEFLYQTREGHCQRFAAGLTLMLRSVGIPASYVMGFKGCEPQGEGNYLIRQDNAHAWVEVLILRPAPPGFPTQRRPANSPPMAYHWLSLDPTPEAGPDETAGKLTGWLGTARETGAAFFKNFIVDYNRDRREATVASARDWLVRGGWVVIGLLSGVAGVLVFRPARKRLPKRRELAGWVTGHDWYDQMIATLVTSGYPVPPGVTPQEYASSVGDMLARHPVLVAISDVPLELTRAFYRARFGGQPPQGEGLDLLKQKLASLQDTLRSATSRPEALS